MTIALALTPARGLDGSDRPPVLGDILRLQAAAIPDAPALSFEGAVVTYRDLAARAFRTANALLARGLRPGDRIAHVGRNSDAWFDLFLGAGVAGMVLVPVNWRLTSGEIAHVVADATAALVFADLAFMPPVEAAVGSIAPTPAIVPIETGFAAWRDTAPADDPGIAVEPDNVVLQIYTSGTTGPPKGALLTHHSINAVRVSQPRDEAWSRWTQDDACLVSMPLFHIGGASMPLSALYHGARMVVVRDFSPEALFELIARERITRLFLVPAAIAIALAHPRARAADYSSLTHIFYGSSPIDAKLLDKAIATFGCDFVQVYGLTETSGTIVVLPPAEHHRAGAAGRPMRGVELAILDEAGAHRPRGEVGEVAVRSAAAMAGYWRRGDATAAAFTADGWLRTGDAGFLDADGYLHLRDRIKDMIISGGENVYAAEVETLFARHPAVAEIAVIGVPDAKWGEAVQAVVVPRPGAAIDAAALIAWGRERLAAYKLPKAVAFVDALPRNASGKVLRRELRGRYGEPED